MMAEDEGNRLYHREKVQGAAVIIPEHGFEPNVIRCLMGRIRESDGTNETIWSLQIRPMVPNVVHKYVG